jgi:copper homeostasis protein
MSGLLIEICVEGVDGAVAAAQAGADRIELCASLLEGGITPSLGVVRAAARRVGIPLHVIVRPRGGDFLYSQAEFDGMLEDVATLGAAGAAGVVVGCLTPDGAIDTARMAALVARARPLSVTCHRAFDMTADADAALEALIACGVDRVLTSGQRATAVEATDTLRRLHRLAAGRIVVMGCGELDATNIATVRAATGLTELHFAALRQQPSAMRYRNDRIGMGGTALEREYTLTLTDADAVRATIAAARSSA